MTKKTIFFDLFGVLLSWGVTGFKPLISISLLKKLSKNHSLWIISNTSNRQIGILKKRFDFFQNFTNIITSETTGYHKPDIAIFEYALQHAKALPNQSIFIDDSIKNIQSAVSLGIVSHHYVEDKKLIQFLEDQCLLYLN